jgi:hypothetical protein
MSATEPAPLLAVLVTRTRDAQLVEVSASIGGGPLTRDELLVVLVDVAAALAAHLKRPGKLVGERDIPASAYADAVALLTAAAEKSRRAAKA